MNKREKEGQEKKKIEIEMECVSKKSFEGFLIQTRS
jgi:hypothetical protein